MRQIPKLLARILSRLAFLGRRSAGIQRRSLGCPSQTPATVNERVVGLSTEPEFPAPEGGLMVAAPRCFHHAPPLRSLPLRAASSGRRTESSDEARAELAPVGRSDLLNLDLDALMLRLLQEPVPGEPGPATNPDQ